MRAELHSPPPIETTGRIVFTKGWLTVVVDPDRIDEVPAALSALIEQFKSGAVDDAIDLAVLDRLPEHDPEEGSP